VLTFAQPGKLHDLTIGELQGVTMWMSFGLACCAIEMMQMSMPRYDAERFGFAPRRCAPAAAMRRRSIMLGIFDAPRGAEYSLVRGAGPFMPSIPVSTDD
jgi:hypothetical protein